jgi:hypothetical protein
MYLKAASSDDYRKVELELSKNPYNDMLLYNSTQEGQFIKDAGNVVNRYQKPISLYLQLLIMFALPNSVIVDATGGTGSLELAAMEKTAPRDLTFLSFERNHFQYKNMELRLGKSCVRPTSVATVMPDATMEQAGL